jgi:heme/copper-type cytochrome/quinol oxidase subunit 2
MLASQTSGAKIGTELEGIVYLMILLGLASIFVAWVLNWSVVKRTKKASTETPEQRQRRVTSRAFAFTWLAIMAVPVIIYLIMFVYLIVMYITW